MKTIQELTELKKEIYDRGHSRGYEIAVYSEIKPLEDKEDEWKEDCYEREQHNRQYSPFEFTAKELNDLDNEFDEMAEQTHNENNILEFLFEPWEEFDNGINAGINEYFESHKR